MKTSLIRKTISTSFGNITIECESQNTADRAIMISSMNDSIVIDYASIPEIIRHLNTLVSELDL